MTRASTCVSDPPTGSRATWSGIAADATTALGNVSDGVQITGGTGNAVTANRIAANGGLGIDLRDDGVTVNDGANTAGQPNLLMDFPVFTSALLAGTSLTVTGYVGSAPGQATFANARVELFVADADPTGFGEGRTHLGSLTADASGNFAGTLTVAGLATGDRLTATATDAAGNTSEFGPNAIIVGPFAVSGTVFEDFNYGGGAGRDRASAAGSDRPAARVELYDAAGGFLSFTATDAAGAYAFSGLAPGGYSVRVVNASVTSSRAGYVAGLLPVQTFRTDAASGVALSVTDHVGGEIPTLVDAGDGATNLAALTTATTTAQSLTPVTLGAVDVTGVDFGFSFNVVANVNDAGQGSLRQFVLNSNALGNAGLAMQGQTFRARRVCVHAQRRSGARGPARRHRQPAEWGGRRRDRARDCAARRDGRVHVGRRHDADHERRRHRLRRARVGGYGPRGWPRTEHGGGAGGRDPRLGHAPVRAPDTGRQRHRARPGDSRLRNRAGQAGSASTPSPAPDREQRSADRRRRRSADPGAGRATGSTSTRVAAATARSGTI